MKNYNLGGKFGNSAKFVDAFKNVVGHFGATGQDNPIWMDWMTGLAKKSEEEVEDEGAINPNINVNMNVNMNVNVNS